MAKIKFGMMMTDARGKLGGHVFSKNTAGAYVRTKVTPTNPQTSAQTTARLIFAAISANWSGISESARAGFNEAVADWSNTDIFGDLKNPTGKELYQRLNNQAQASGWPAVTSVPEKQILPLDVVSDVKVDISDATLTLSGASVLATVRVALFATAPLTAGTRFVKNRLRQIYTAPANAFVPGSAYLAYVAKFGVPEAGQNVHFGIKYVMDNGQAAPMQSIKGEIEA